MDFIDPVLHSSAKPREMRTRNFKSVFIYVVLFIVVAFVIWVGYALYTARLDTRPENTIKVNPDLIDGPAAPANSYDRQEGVSETL
jgi:type VI protein secretion system component VasF